MSGKYRVNCRCPIHVRHEHDAHFKVFVVHKGVILLEVLGIFAEFMQQKTWELFIFIFFLSQFEGFHVEPEIQEDSKNVTSARRLGFPCAFGSFYWVNRNICFHTCPVFRVCFFTSPILPKLSSKLFLTFVQLLTLRKVKDFFRQKKVTVLMFFACMIPILSMDWYSLL